MHNYGVSCAVSQIDSADIYRLLVGQVAVLVKGEPELSVAVNKFDCPVTVGRSRRQQIGYIVACYDKLHLAVSLHCKFLNIYKVVIVAAQV